MRNNGKYFYARLLIILIVILSILCGYLAIEVGRQKEFIDHQIELLYQNHVDSFVSHITGYDFDSIEGQEMISKLNIVSDDIHHSLSQLEMIQMLAPDESYKFYGYQNILMGYEYELMNEIIIYQCDQSKISNKLHKILIDLELIGHWLNDQTNNKEYINTDDFVQEVYSKLNEELLNQMRADNYID